MWRALLLLVAVGTAQAQLTAQSSVAPDLRECYMDVNLLNRNNLPPTTASTFIDIIRKIEDNHNVNVDLRQLAVLLLHTYRQDGIEYHQPDATLAAATNVLPYAPTFHSYHRHRLLLTKLIPNNLQVLGNETLNSALKCALHNMLSTTVDARLRGDEGNCYQLSQLRAMRTPRDLSTYNDDVEILDESQLNSANQNGQMRQYNPKEDIEYNSYAQTRSERQVLGDSQCPIVRGVISTQWGGVSAGNLIAGIAAGAEAQHVALSELTKGTVLNEYPNMQQYVTSIFPATVSGDIAEAALIQGTERATNAITIGATGGFNSTVARRYFMVQSRVNIEMTDPEIRGDIDGFVLGLHLPTILNTYNTLKLSQLLDMYYSPRNGVYNPNFRACNRKALSQQFILNDNLLAETYAFAAALDTNMPLRGTITNGLAELVTNAVQNFQNYVANNLQDITCLTTEETSEDFLYRVKANLYLVVDAAWQYDVVYPAISQILHNIEIGKFGSSVTLLSAFDGSVIVNKTYSPADFHSEYTLAKHQSMMLGVNLETVYTNVRTLMVNELDIERTNNYVGGNSSILLFLLNTGNLQNNEHIWEHARFLNDSVPDLHVIYATSANQQNNLYNLVRDMHRDIITVSLTNGGVNIDATLTTLETRLRSFGRRIANPVCGSEWNTGALSGTRQFEEFVEPGYINYYAIRANYFYQNNDNRKVRITRTGGGVGNFVICHSRTVVKPRQNSTFNLGNDEHEVNCQTITGTGNVEISLANACSNSWTINTCPPFYISVQSELNGVTAATAVCTDSNVCRFPYNNRYTITIEDFGCYSGVGNIFGNILLISLSLLYILFRHV